MGLQIPQQKPDGGFIYNKAPQQRRQTSQAPLGAYYTTNQERDAWNMDSVLNQSLQALNDQGIDPNSQYGRGAITTMYQTLKQNGGQQPMPMPTPQRGRSGGGGSPQQRALQAMYSMWARPQDNTLIDAITRLTGDARTQGQDALSKLTAGLQAQQNPYASAQMPMPQVTGNPMAQYMQANGASTGQADALQALLGSTAQQTQAADQAYLSQMQAAWNAQQQARMADAAQSGQMFDQSLSNTSLGLQYQERQRQQQAKDALMMQMLQAAMSNGLDLSKFGGLFK